MNAAAHLKPIILSGLVLSAAAITNQGSNPLYNQVLRVLGQNGAKRIWRALCVLFLLLNLKSLPFFWHVRIFTTLIDRSYIRPSKFTPENGPRALFQPLITSSRTTLLETDYNLHKSNSTYFSDLDISRLHLMLCLFQKGCEKLGAEKWEGAYVPVKVYLGGVTCTFRREIKPFEPYDIWSRVLCWDRKWIYIVSHIVKKGVVKPKGYTFQPNKGKRWTDRLFAKAKSSNQQSAAGSHLQNGISDGQPPHDAIFATSIAKYVAKRGRLTIGPERLLDAAGLLPPKPAQAPDGSTNIGGSASVNELSSPAESVEPQLNSGTIGLLGEVWDWDRIEAERLEGMKVADHMAGLDGLLGAFTGDTRAALGRYKELPW
ncbi:MAG: hypothetical protein M1824_004040 [Vezdaea acicularis]|nr:MAG: hypothetical protein M1824_004040 [Vezdaea acicularis]